MRESRRCAQLAAQLSGSIVVRTVQRGRAALALGSGRRGSRRVVFMVAGTVSLLACFALVSAPAYAAPSSSYAVTEVPITAGNPNSVAVDPVTDTVYAGLTNVGAVAVIDGSSNAETAQIDLPASPDSGAAETVAVDPATDTVYAVVADNVAGETATAGVDVIDGATGAVTATIALPTPLLAYAAAVDPVTDMLYVTDYDDDTVIVINGNTDAVAATISLADAANPRPSPRGVAVDTTTNTIYVADLSDNQVDAIDGTTDTVTGQIALPAGSGPVGVAADPAAGLVYVADQGTGSISVIDTATDDVSILASGMTEPRGLALDTGSDTLYVTSTIGSADGLSTTYVVDTASGAIDAQIPRGGTSAAVLTPGGSVYAAGGLSGDVTVITPSTVSTMSPVIIGFPAGFSATVGQPVQEQLQVSATPAATVSATGLPTGLTLSPSGLLAGTPAAGTGGSYPITFTATNSAGTATQAFTLIVTSVAYQTITVLPADAGGGSAGGFAAWAVDSAGALWYGTQSARGSAWTWTYLGGGFQGTVAVEPVDAGGGSSGGFAVWVVDSSGNLRNGWQTSPGSAWQWADLGGGNQGTPQVTVEPVSAGGGTGSGFAIWLVDGSGRLMNGWQTATGSGWQWASLASGFHGPPAVDPVSAGGGTGSGFAAWAVDTTGNLWNGWQTSAGSAWQWADMGGGNTGTPAVTVQPLSSGGENAGGFAIWLVDGSGRLMNGWQTATGSGWTWTALNTGFQGTPAVEPVSAGGGTGSGFAAWAVDTSGNLWNGQQSSAGSAWTWANLQNGEQGTVAVEPVNSGGGTTGGFAVWAVESGGNLLNGLQSSPGSAWTWTSLGFPGG